MAGQGPGRPPRVVHPDVALWADRDLGRPTPDVAPYLQEVARAGVGAMETRAYSMGVDEPHRVARWVIKLLAEAWQREEESVDVGDPY